MTFRSPADVHRPSQAALVDQRAIERGAAAREQRNQALPFEGGGRLDAEEIEDRRAEIDQADVLVDPPRGDAGPAHQQRDAHQLLVQRLRVLEGPCSPNASP